MSLTTVLGITVLGHHRVNRSLRTSANLDFANRNCFDLLVKMIAASPIARVIAGLSLFQFLAVPM